MVFANILMLFIGIGSCLGQGKLLSKEKERRSLEEAYGYYYEPGTDGDDAAEEPSHGPELDISYCAQHCEMRYAPPDEYVHDQRIEHLLVGDGVNIQNYRTAFKDQFDNLIDLGETTTTEHYDWDDSERTVEQTSLAQGTFIFDQFDEIVFGTFEHEWIPPQPIENADGDMILIKLWSKSEVYKDHMGRLVRSIYPAHEIEDTRSSGDPNADVQTFGALESEVSEEQMMEDAMIGSWIGGLSDSGRRKLWLKSLKKRPSRRRLGRHLEANGQQQIEIHVAFHYTAEALFWFTGGHKEMRDKADFGIQEMNLALHNSGVSDLKFIMNTEFLLADLSEHRSWASWALSMSRSDRSVADINVLIMSRSQMDGRSGEVLLIPILEGGNYEHASAFARINLQSLPSLTLAHELGHLLGLGHNAGTTHCHPNKFSQCAHVIKCGDGGYKTVMAYDSASMIDKIVQGSRKKWFSCNEKPTGKEIRVKQFSNPTIHYIQQGIDYGVTGTKKANTVSQIFYAMDHVPYYVSPDVDCEGSWGPCSADCTREFTQSMLKRGNGADCPPEPICAPGEDMCPHPQDCQGHWSACTEQCEVAADREFTITTHPNMHGDPCPTVGTDCLPGEDLCPRIYAVAKVGTTSYIRKYNPGCTESAGDCTTQLKEPQHSHLAVCCSENEIRGWRRFPGCTVFAPIHSVCPSMSWENADQYCKAKGARLCSADELETNCALAACGGSNSPDNGKLAWSISEEVAEKPEPPQMKTPIDMDRTGIAKFCVSTGDPHLRAPWRRFLNKFNDHTIGEVDFFRINGLRILSVQDTGSRNNAATVHAVKIFHNNVMATISVSKLDIPEPMVFSHTTRKHWTRYNWFKYQITFPDFPNVVFGWNHWISPWWGAQLNIGVRYNGDWSTVGGQCGDPANPAAMDCDDCKFGHPEEMNMNPPTCQNLQTCCSYFDDDDFMKASCLLDYHATCCNEDDSDETCCDDMKPPLCPHDMQCDENEFCNVATGECIEN